MHRPRRVGTLTHMVNDRRTTRAIARPRSRTRARGVGAGAVVLMAMACRTGSPPPAAPTQIDRLVGAYPELRTGRFVLIADFENPAHTALFRLDARAGRAAIERDPRGGRKETGSAGLRLRKVSNGDTLIAANSSATDWYLKRDWHEYDLLVMSVHAPRDGVAVDATIAAGAAEIGASATSTVPLRRGWNTIRLDLGELRDRIALGDVREIRLGVGGADRPIDLRLDDLLLTSARIDLFGNPENRSGAMYVRQIGQRWRVGAGGRFELTMGNGQFVEWYNLAADPHRLRNLLRGATLGPSPTTPGPTGDGGAFDALGRAVVARPRIVEMNAVRTVITSDWRFVDEPDRRSGKRASDDRSLDERPFQRWRYTIYATGQIYAEVEATAQTETWTPPRLDLAVSMAAANDDTPTMLTYPAHDGGPSGTPPYGSIREGAGDALLLFVPGAASPAGRITATLDAPGRRATLTLVDDRPIQPVRRWTAHVLLGASSEITDEQAGARAGEYANPPPLTLDIGRVAVAGDGPWRPTETGFDPASGSYVIVPDSGQVRFVLDGRAHAFHTPAFTIVDTVDRTAWVYVDHLIHAPVGRDADGRLVFQLPGRVSDVRRVEVLLQPVDNHRS